MAPRSGREDAPASVLVPVGRSDSQPALTHDSDGRSAELTNQLVADLVCAPTGIAFVYRALDHIVGELALEATRIAGHHCDVPVAVELVRSPSAPAPTA